MGVTEKKKQNKKKKNNYNQSHTGTSLLLGWTDIPPSPRPPVSGSP